MGDGSGLRDRINEKRAKQGKNALATGKTGKGSQPRLNDLPDWHYYRIYKVTKTSVWLEILAGHYKVVLHKEYFEHMIKVLKKEKALTIEW